MVFTVLAKMGLRLLRRSIALGLALMMAIALTACSVEQFRTQAAQVPRYVFSSLSDPKTFNFIVSDEQSSQTILGFLYDGLLSTNGVTGELEPGLAESWQVSDDQLRIVFTLRDGLKWSDGEPMTVDDVVFTYNDIIFNEDIPTSLSDIFRVGAQGQFPIVRKVDDRRVEFISPEPFAPLLRFAGGSFAPKHALEKYVHTKGANGQSQFFSTWGTNTNPHDILSSGPYQIKSYEPSQRVILERNPYYWRKDAQGNPQPYIEQIVIQIIESDDAALAQFRSGGLDEESIKPDYFALLKREDKRGNFTIYNGGPALSTTFMTFNLNQGSRDGKPLIDPMKVRWFNTLAFRQAVAHAIDRPTMINNIYQGLGAPQHSPIYQKRYYFSPEEGLPTYNYDPAKAKTLLLGAGFKYNAANQLVDEQGNLVRFTLITNAGNKIREAMGSQIKQDLSKIGIQVDFQPIAFNTILNKLDNTLDWESLILSIGGATYDPDGGKNTWSPDGRLHMFNQKPTSGSPLEGRKVADWEKEIYRLYVQGGQVFDDTKRKAIYAQVQTLAQEYLPFIYLVNPLSLAAVRNHVEGIQYSAEGGTTWNIYELRLKD
jgi:peptide/nickel transport system substrate-binding protein